MREIKFRTWDNMNDIYMAKLHLLICCSWTAYCEKCEKAKKLLRKKLMEDKQ